MARNTLARHAPGTILGYRKSGKPIFPIAGGSEPPTPPVPPTPPAPTPPTPPNDPAPGEEAVNDKGEKLGFPAKTPVEQMSDKQAAAYWRNQSKVQQHLADQRKDYDDVKAAADKWRAHETEQQTPADKALAEAELKGKKAAAGDAAMASLRVILQTRGKDEKEVSDLLEFVSSERFLTADGLVDHQKVMTYADKLTPSGSQNGGSGGYGQGRFEQTTQSRSAAGVAEAERRFGKKS
jgi:hypothetical protein